MSPQREQDSPFHYIIIAISKNFVLGRLQTTETNEGEWELGCSKYNNI